MQNYKIIITRNTSVYTFYNLCFGIGERYGSGCAGRASSFDYVLVPGLSDLCSPFLDVYILFLRCVSLVR